MKSAFAPEESETYAYPTPLGKDHERVDQEVLDELAKPGADKVWVTIRIPRSKGDNDAVGDWTQNIVTSSESGDTSIAARIARGNQGVFGLLAEKWSFTSEKPAGSDYSRLDMWAAVWIDSCLADALAKGQSVIAKKTPSTSKPRSSTRGVAAAAKE